MFNTLAYIGQKLNAEKVTWGVGASILLNHYGLISHPKDIDLLVSLEDIKRTDLILSSLGEKMVWEKSATYSTEYFYEYKINGCDIDVMSGLKIHFANGIFVHDFNEQSITEIVKMNAVDIPFTSLEDWYVIYQLINHREEKVRLIETYLLQHGVKHPMILEKALSGELPVEVRVRIEKLISNRDNGLNG